MVWNYIAVNASAHEVRGVELGAYHEVSVRLAARGLCLVALDLNIPQTFKNMVSSGKIPSDSLGGFFRDFSNMLAAGLTLDHVLMMFVDTGMDARIVAACSRMSESLSSGSSLAQAMAASGRFPRLAVSVVAAGERAGDLVLVMDLLAEHFRLAGELKGKCYRAFIYPAGIMVFLLSALVYVAEYVTPQLMPLLPPEAMEGFVTRFMLGLSQCVRTGWMWLLSGLAAVSGAVIFTLRRDARILEKLLSRIPLIGVLRQEFEIALCFFDLFVRLKSGIPLDTALLEASADARNAAGAALGFARQSLSAGYTFSGALHATGYFPRLVVETIKLGEQIGCYDGYCERVFRFYYRSFETRIGFLTGLLQPSALFLCACFVAAMAFAFLQPIYGNLTRIGALNP